MKGVLLKLSILFIFYIIIVKIWYIYKIKIINFEEGKFEKELKNGVKVVGKWMCVIICVFYN